VATVLRRNLSDPVGNLRKQEHVLKNAIDAVFFGI
jgi:hypothetical protein